MYSYTWHGSILDKKSKSCGSSKTNVQPSWESMNHLENGNWIKYKLYFQYSRCKKTCNQVVHSLRYSHNHVMFCAWGIKYKAISCLAHHHCGGRNTDVSEEVCFPLVKVVLSYSVTALVFIIAKCKVNVSSWLSNEHSALNFNKLADLLKVNQSVHLFNISLLWMHVLLQLLKNHFSYKKID